MRKSWAICGRRCSHAGQSARRWILRERFGLSEQQAFAYLQRLSSEQEIKLRDVAEDLDRSRAIARRLRAGTIGLNGTAPYGADTPFGGYKSSGVGREFGPEGLAQYTELKAIYPTAP